MRCSHYEVALDYSFRWLPIGLSIAIAIGMIALRVHPFKGPFNEPTNHADDRPTKCVSTKKRIDRHDRFDWSADQCCLSI